MLGPYSGGLGIKNNSTTLTDTDGRERYDDFCSDHDGNSLQNKRMPTVMCAVSQWEAAVIPKFDPAKKTTNVQGWLNKIDQLGDLYLWDERDRIFIMQIRLRGAAREWYDDLEEYAISWTQWKETLTRAFSRSLDYVDLLEEMLARVKRNRETMTKYFHDKMALLRKCSLEGEAAISCVIRGLPDEIRASAKAYKCVTPEELFHGFLSSLENYETTWERGSYLPETDVDCRRTRFNSRQAGHEARECLMTGYHRCDGRCQRLGSHGAGHSTSHGSRDGRRDRHYQRDAALHSGRRISITRTTTHTAGTRRPHKTAERHKNPLPEPTRQN